MLIDTHSHVNFRSFKGDADDVIRRSLDQDTWLINVGTQFETSRKAVELAENYAEGVYAAVGLHPVHLFDHHVDEEETSFTAANEKFNAGSYRELVLRSTKVVAIGEFGLDYYRLPPGDDPDRIKTVQREVARQHIRLAEFVDKPLMLHVRPSTGTMDAYEDLLMVLDEENSSPLVGEARRGVIHSFTGSWNIAQEFLKRGFYIGVNGIVTFDKTGRSEEVVKNTPLDRIVLETDAPYLTPIPHRGKRNEPAYVKFVAAKVAEFKGLDVSEVEMTTTANARALFNI